MRTYHQGTKAEMSVTRKRQRTSSLSSAAPSPPSSTTSRSNGEWEKLEKGSVLMLPPTTTIVHDVLHTASDSVTPAVKIAAFDMDDTVIKPASGGVFAKDDPADWQWVHPQVCGHLQHLHQHGFLIVLFSNQMGIGKGGKWNAAKADAIMEKIILLSRDAAVPLCACVATRDDVWRKPSPRLWKLLEMHVAQCARNSERAKTSVGYEGEADPAVNCASYSFYVGDAAGRSTPTLAGRKKDFSCADRQFAYNLQLPFFTPEQFFTCGAEDLLQVDPTTKLSGSPSEHPSFRLSTTLLRQSAPASDAACALSFSWGDVNPEELQLLPRTYAQLSVPMVTPTAVTTVSLPTEPPFFAKPGQEQEMIIFVGFPGCGKSSFFRRHLQPYGYHHVNRDTLQTRAKCIRATEEHWAKGHRVVIDNTNPTAEDRQAYIDVVKKHASQKKSTGAAAAGVLPVRIFFFTHSRGLANHMNVVRAYVEGVPRVPSIAYSVFQSRLQRPTTAAEVAALGVEALWEIPPVACFDGVPAETEKAFSMLL
jgi:bifunctional polynucleotide phosphatase/kinase